MSKQIRALVAQNIRKFRLRLGASPEAMAELLNISVDEYVERELGEADFTSVELFVIARQLGVTMEQLFTPDGGNH